MILAMSPSYKLKLDTRDSSSRNCPIPTTCIVRVKARLVLLEIRLECPRCPLLVIDIIQQERLILLNRPVAAAMKLAVVNAMKYLRTWFDEEIAELLSRTHLQYDLAGRAIVINQSNG